MKKKEFIDSHINKLREQEYIHSDFSLLVSSYQQNAEDRPIILKGQLDSGKETMAKQLAKVLAKDCFIYDFSHSTINDTPYFDQNFLLESLKIKESAGAFIVIKDFDMLDTYDSFLLINYFYELRGNKNPSSAIIITDNNAGQIFRQLSEVVRRSSAVVAVSKDPVIEKIIKEKEESKQKQKSKKGVIN